MRKNEKLERSMRLGVRVAGGQSQIWAARSPRGKRRDMDLRVAVADLSNVWLRGAEEKRQCAGHANL